MIKEQDAINQLEKLGFKTASAKVKHLSERKRKLAIAYEHYRFVRKEKIQDFNQKLKEKTERHEIQHGFMRTTYQQLTFTPVESYAEVPPQEVLAELETAINRNCFDAFEVAHIVDVVKVPDPILFGTINGCSDKFFIAQWDNDCRIEDILGANEG